MTILSIINIYKSDAVTKICTFFFQINTTLSSEFICNLYKILCFLQNFVKKVKNAFLIGAVKDENALFLLLLMNF